jgi:DNA-nicking Smr family endonuclease
VRRVTPEERELFLEALAGRLPARQPRAKAKSAHHGTEKSPPEVSSGSKPAAKSAQHTVPLPAGGRRASDADILLFLEAIGLYVPAVTAPEVKTQAPKTPIKTSAKAATKNPAGLDGNTERRLERGDIAPTAKLDLHGLTESAAHGTLLTFLIAAHRRGDRLVLVVTGKGAAADSDSPLFERGRGVLRQMVPRWLDEAPMAKIVADKRWSHRRHGGDGALYIYLRKNGRA